MIEIKTSDMGSLTNERYNDENLEETMENSGVRNVSLIDNPELRVSDIEFLRMLWTTLNRARTE